MIFWSYEAQQSTPTWYQSTRFMTFYLCFEIFGLEIKIKSSWREMEIIVASRTSKNSKSPCSNTKIWVGKILGVFWRALLSRWEILYYCKNMYGSIYLYHHHTCHTLCSITTSSLPRNLCTYINCWLSMYFSNISYRFLVKFGFQACLFRFYGILWKVSIWNLFPSHYYFHSIDYYFEWNSSLLMACAIS